ncbi:class I tRNA ligase family protein [Patescibacteria group bacterium]|nr:class I tRNA ligase family protein [Patescibacteria group bacterium]
MSKSKGTGLDPLVLTEQYGTDALRLGLVIGNTAGQDFRLYPEKVAGYKKFANKLWNISRFILSQDFKCCSYGAKTLAGNWILGRLNQVIIEVTDNLANHHFSETGNLLYEFVWHELADWYLEVCKFQPHPEMLYHLLINVLKLLHPFMPFITEEIWSSLPNQNLLIIETWPQPETNLIKEDLVDQFKQLQKIVTDLRNGKKDNRIPPQEII